MVKLNSIKRIRFLNTPRWNFSKLEKLVIAVTITAILLVAAFGFLLDSKQNQPAGSETQNYSPTATPSPTPEDTASPSATKTTSPTSNPTSNSPKNPRGPPPPIPPVNPDKVGLIESNPGMGSSVWVEVAKNAWNFFQPGLGLDSTTGLPASSEGWNFFTDWDLGVYIQAVIDAEKIGLISKDGDWGSRARLDKVMVFLETRELASNGSPHWFYSSDLKEVQVRPDSDIDIADAGTLLAALSNLKAYDSSFSSRVDNFVYNRADASKPHNSNSRTNYESLVPSLKAESSSSTSIYSYYVMVGFADFFPELREAPNNVLNNMRNAGTVTTYNSTLPKAKILCEPLLYSVFNLRHRSDFNPYLNTLMNQTYSAHEARFNATGGYVAFSEGIGPSSFIWEWVVLPSGETWKIADKGDASGPYLDISPVMYTKVSLSFLALYNTSFSYNMSVYIEKVSPDPVTGYNAGADYSREILASKVYASVDSNTNGLIVAAARYALGR